MAEADTTRRELTQVTAASAVIFGMLMGSYVLVVWLLGALQAVENSGQTWWIALVVVLALGAAAGLGFSYQVLRLLGAGDILRRMGRISAEAAARWLPEEAGVSADSDVETVHRARAEGDQDLIPVVDGERTLDGVITSTDLIGKRDATTARELMTDRPTVAKATDSLADVLVLMRASGHDNIPVVSEEGKYVGTITPRLMLEALQGQTMRR